MHSLKDVKAINSILGLHMDGQTPQCTQCSLGLDVIEAVLKPMLTSDGEKGLHECPSEAETGSVMISWVMGHVKASRRSSLLCWLIPR